MDGEDRIRKALGKEQEAYPCVWYEALSCPIRTKWKLTPENLEGWCRTCKDIGYLDEQRALVKARIEKK